MATKHFVDVIVVATVWIVRRVWVCSSARNAGSECGVQVIGEAVVGSDGKTVVHTHCAKPYSDRIAGRIHPCPKCGGTGKVKHPTEVRRYTVEVPNDYMCGPRDPQTRTEHRQEPVIVPCDLCDGHGKLTAEPVPITDVVGWERSKETTCQKA